jgi:hypothetical protein
VILNGLDAADRADWRGRDQAGRWSTPTLQMSSRGQLIVSSAELRTRGYLMARSFRHWTPTYVKDRLLQQFDLWAHPTHPWLTRDAVRLLEQLLRPADVGFEWGSGRSTVWLSERVARLTSVEHDHAWFDLVSARLAARGFTNVDYQHHPVGAPEEADESSACAPYVRAVDAVADAALDFALVDGWFRAACCLGVLTKLRAGGLLILDNANRYLPPPAGLDRAPASRPRAQGPRGRLWSTFQEGVISWRRIWTLDGVTNTLILFKP